MNTSNNHANYSYNSFQDSSNQPSFLTNLNLQKLTQETGESLVIEDDNSEYPKGTRIRSYEENGNKIRLIRTPPKLVRTYLDDRNVYNFNKFARSNIHGIN